MLSLLIILHSIVHAQRTPVYGPYGQDCTPPLGDHPDACPTVGQTKNAVLGKLECKHNYDCCTCGLMECKDCTELSCNGDYSCYGAKNIQLFGGAAGALINCNGDDSCKECIIRGEKINKIACTGDFSCAYSMMELTCLSTLGCLMECVGDNACSANPNNLYYQNAVYLITNSNGLSCSIGACQYATFSFVNNKGGPIMCTSRNSCTGSTIIADKKAEYILCGGMDACRDSRISVTNPSSNFRIECQASSSCKNMALFITITDPTITSLGYISCGGMSSCENMYVSIKTTFPFPANKKVTMGYLSCNAMDSCLNSRYDLSPNVEFSQCFCATGAAVRSCDGLFGIPQCVV